MLHTVSFASVLELQFKQDGYYFHCDDVLKMMM